MLALVGGTAFAASGDTTGQVRVSSAQAAPICGIDVQGPRIASDSSAGIQGNGASENPAVSNDGRYVAFESFASNLVIGDLNGLRDVFVRNVSTGNTSWVSVHSNGKGPNGRSLDPSISSDGHYVAFDSFASNLVTGDLNGKRDVFVRNTATHSTSLVSVQPATKGGSNAQSFDPSISGSGRFIAFTSNASNLVPGDTNHRRDVFVRDRKAHKTTRVSVSTSGAQGKGASDRPSISGDGRYVAFTSSSSNLVSGDKNGTRDVFVRDRVTNRTSRMSYSSSGKQGNDSSIDPSISSDGRYVAFTSFATNLVSGDTNDASDAFVRDRKTFQTSRMSVSSSGTQANDSSSHPSISSDGQFVAFQSLASNLVSGDTNGKLDVFVRDRNPDTPHTTLRESESASGQQANNASRDPSISGSNGPGHDHPVAFASDATNLVSSPNAPDTNGKRDAFFDFVCTAG